jgi:hypothetical protein
MSERQKAIERLRAVKLTEGMSSHEMLSAIGRALFPAMKMWNQFTCMLLREELVWLLESANEEIDAVRHECEERIARIVEHYTCEMEASSRPEGEYDWEPTSTCSKCGAEVGVIGVGHKLIYVPNFCPNCGRKVNKS